VPEIVGDIVNVGLTLNVALTVDVIVMASTFLVSIKIRPKFIGYPG
jgi:hypothetical protein